MRLIDADELKEQIGKFLELNQETMLYDDETFNMIDNAPTVEERPTGEWVEELTLDRWVQEMPSVYYCSRCRSEPFGDNLYNYCPNCGAKMKGAEE